MLVEKGKKKKVVVGWHKDFDVRGTLRSRRRVLFCMRPYDRTCTEVPVRDYRIKIEPVLAILSLNMAYSGKLY